MTQTLTHTLSPLEQAGRSNRMAMTQSSAALSPEDQATLKQVLTGKYEFVANDLFGKAQAEAVLFEDAEAVPRPDTSWYHPVMESMSERRAAKNPATVLLTASQERTLFLQFNFCRFRVCGLRDKLGEAPISMVMAKDILHWHRRAERYRDQIAQTNLALVLAMAKRIRLTEMDFSDLISEGNMALLRAIDKFDVARGFKFSTYACRAILKAFSRSGVKLSRYRQFFPTDFDPKLEKSNYQSDKRDTHEDECVDELRQIIRSNTAELTQIEQEVIEHRFAVGDNKAQATNAAPLTLEQVGKIIGVTKERVRQIQNKALEKIRHTLEADFLI